MTIKTRLIKLEKTHKGKQSAVIVAVDDDENPNIVTVAGERMTQAEFKTWLEQAEHNDPDAVVIHIVRGDGKAIPRTPGQVRVGVDINKV